MADRADRRLGALLGTFVGDALGMPFEGAPPLAAPEPLDLQEARLGRGTYTDDTEMMIGLLEVLVERGEPDEQALAERFLANHDRRRGYGGGTLTVFALWRRGEPVDRAAELAFEGGSFGNGAAMRVAPIGVLHAEGGEALIEAAVRSARVTHAHPLGVAGAVAQAAAVAAALRGDDPLTAAIAYAAAPGLRGRLKLARAGLDDSWGPDRVAFELGNGSAAHESVPAAVCAATRARSFEDACTFAVRIGGDADTIAAMAGAVAGARFGASTIPRRWLEPLEDGARGRSYVEALSGRLAPLHSPVT
jgi:ADP-ribosylglycohydrolase